MNCSLRSFQTLYFISGQPGCRSNLVKRHVHSYKVAGNFNISFGDSLLPRPLLPRYLIFLSATGGVSVRSFQDTNGSRIPLLDG